MSYTLRSATAADGEFLVDMLVAAVNWADRPGLGRREILATPQFAHYVTGWPRAGDLGVVAEAGDERIGATWLRHFDVDDPGYGFVAADVPELSIAVAAAWRGQGVGRALLRDLVSRAASHGIGRMSLSVEHANPAMRLYTREGFCTVSSDGGAATMVTDLPQPTTSGPAAVQ